MALDNTTPAAAAIPTDPEAAGLAQVTQVARVAQVAHQVAQVAQVNLGGIQPAQPATIPDTAPVNQQPRKRGRPKGSKNKQPRKKR
jgi:hypothetical protein